MVIDAEREERAGVEVMVSRLNRNEWCGFRWDTDMEHICGLPQHHDAEHECAVCGQKPHQCAIYHPTTERKAVRG